MIYERLESAEGPYIIYLMCLHLGGRELLYAASCGKIGISRTLLDGEFSLVWRSLSANASPPADFKCQYRLVIVGVKLIYR